MVGASAVIVIVCMARLAVTCLRSFAAGWVPITTKLLNDRSAADAEAKHAPPALCAAGGSIDYAVKQYTYHHLNL